MTKGRASHGIVFRMIDAFNYYAFELNIERGYKRITKVEDGAMTIIKRIDDGGTTQNAWFKVEITGSNNKFKIKMGEDKKYKKYDHLPVVFEFVEEAFVQGK